MPANRRNLLFFAVFFLLNVCPLFPQATTEESKQDSQSSMPDHKRILGVIPNFQTVSDPKLTFSPLTAKEKFALFAKNTFDPFTIASAAAGAALSQAGDGHPQYGQGSGPYAQRFGAAMADVTTQNFFSDAVLASLMSDCRTPTIPTVA